MFSGLSIANSYKIERKINMSSKRKKDKETNSNTYLIGGKEYNRIQINKICCAGLGIEPEIGRKKIGEYLLKNASDIGLPHNFSYIEYAKYIITGEKRKTLTPEEALNSNRILRAERVEKLSKVGDKFSKENLKKNTPAVKKLKQLLIDLGLPFEDEYPVVIESSTHFNLGSKLYLLDFYIPHPFNFVIEVDGGYHTVAEQKEYDRKRDLSISGKGLGRTIRFTNEQVLMPSFNLSKELRRKRVKCFVDDLYTTKKIYIAHMYLEYKYFFHLKSLIEDYLTNNNSTSHQDFTFDKIFKAIEDNLKTNKNLPLDIEDCEVLKELIDNYVEIYEPYDSQKNVFRKIINYYEDNKDKRYHKKLNI